jgi:hypothetical protein
MENGQRMRANISRKIMDTDAANRQVIKFLTEAGEEAFDKIIACNELSDLIEKRNQEEEEHGNTGWAFKAISKLLGSMWVRCPQVITNTKTHRAMSRCSRKTTPRRTSLLSK